MTVVGKDMGWILVLEENDRDKAMGLELVLGMVMGFLNLGWCSLVDILGVLTQYYFHFSSASIDLNC